MIWCVEDDKNIQDIEIYTLKSTGFDAEGFDDAKGFFDALKNDLPDLIILDIMLPDSDGVEILQILKKNSRTQDIPVIMATAKGMEYDKIQSLDLGADDYLVKPFGMMEMVSRVKAVLRRCNHGGKNHILKFNNLVMNNDNHTVTVDGTPVILTYKEYEILRLFLEHTGSVFTRDRLFNDIWGSDYIGESRTVDIHINTLRKKLGKYGSYIKTVRSVGYRMEADD